MTVRLSIGLHHHDRIRRGQADRPARHTADTVEALVTRARMDPVLVTGATGRVGCVVVAQLLDAGVPVRALTRRPATAGLPAAVEVVAATSPLPSRLMLRCR